MTFMPGMFPAGAAAAKLASFPIVPATNTSGTTGFTSETTHAVALPSGVQAGDLLIVVIALQANAARTVSTPSGWTQLFNITGGGNLRRFAAYYKTASGSEGGSVSVIASDASAWACNSYRITSFQGTPEAATATGSSSSPNPPSRAASWGSAKNLWLAVEADIATSTTTPSAPTNYASQISASHVVIGNNTCRASSARRELGTDTEDPGTFSLGGSGEWAAATIAIRPA